MWARLAPGVTPRAAEQELLALTNQLRKQYPKLIWDDEYILSEPGGHGKIMRPEMYQVAAMVGALVLLILVVACANLGGLMMARGISREHEIGIRIAIGANRKRIFRQLFTESLLLALLGSVAGLALSCIVMRDHPRSHGRPALDERDSRLARAPVYRRLGGPCRCAFRACSGVAGCAPAPAENVSSTDFDCCSARREFSAAHCGGAVGPRCAPCSLHRPGLWIRAGFRHRTGTG